jgi:hypothetical protein
MTTSRKDLFPLLAIGFGGAIALAVSTAVIVSASSAMDRTPVPATWSTGESSTWAMSVDLGRAGSGDVRFELTREGDRIAGTYRGAMGRDLPVEGTVTDGLIEFSFESDEGKVTYEGTLAGTQVAGVSDYGERGAGTFRGSRRR